MAVEVEWDSVSNRVLINGKHKRNKRRMWKIELIVASPEVEETMNISPTSALNMTELEPFIRDLLDEFTVEHGIITRASFTARAK